MRIRILKPGLGSPRGPVCVEGMEYGAETFTDSEMLQLAGNGWGVIVNDVVVVPEIVEAVIPVEKVKTTDMEKSRKHGKWGKK